MDDKRDSQRAQDPALLQALHIGMDSNCGHTPYLDSIMGFFIQMDF
jgi:hypothetical protein